MTRGRYCCACLFFPACTILLTGKWCIRPARRNTAVSQQAAIQSPSHLLIRDLQGLNYGTQCHCSWVSRLLSRSPRAPRTLLFSHYVGNVRAFPLAQLCPLQNGEHSARSFYWETSWGYISWWLFQTEGKRGRRAFKRMHTRWSETGERPSVSIIMAYSEQLMGWDWR